MIKNRLIIIAAFIAFLTGCNHSNKANIHPCTLSKKSIPTLKMNVVAKKDKVRLVSVKNPFIKQRMIVNKMHGMLVNTNEIGTPDHPTIEGGIINSTDNVIVNNNAMSVETKIPIINAKQNILPQQHQPSFQDDWATSGKIKQFLTAANTQGKLDYVLKKSDQMRLPASIAVLPMVESNYDGNAISTKGAGGAWQLMPETAERYGIKEQDRFRFSTSTDTALKLLSDLHQQFGNWELAFAAYNAGSNRIRIALQKNPQAKSIDELELPLETKVYVKRIMSINKKMMELQKNG